MDDVATTASVAASIRKSVPEKKPAAYTNLSSRETATPTTSSGKGSVATTLRVAVSRADKVFPLVLET